jgi:methylmalonyl-CoA mutase
MTRQSPDKLDLLQRSLADEFEVPSYEQWRREAEDLLKGASFDKRMFTPTVEGITLKPLYCREDIADLPGLSSLPGQPPFVRGQQAVSGRCMITQRFTADNPQQTNAALRHDLQRGLGGIILEPHLQTIDQAIRVFDQIDPVAVPVIIDCGEHGLSSLAILVAAIRSRDLSAARLRGAIAADPVASLLTCGRLQMPLNDVLDQMAVMTAWGIEIAPSLGTIWVHGEVHHNAGASAVQELAATMATGLYYVRRMEQRGLVPETVLPRMRFSYGVGTAFFMEIAKLRAARLLWQRLLEAADVDPDDRTMWMHARSSETGLSRMDSHTNLLRVTTGALAAAVAGVDSIETAPFDLSGTNQGEFSRRLARNTQLVLADEVHLDTVTDPAGGCWYIEWLTHELARRGWELFQEIEQQGGILKAITGGWWQKQIAETATRRHQASAQRKTVLVGTSAYPAPRSMASISGESAAKMAAPWEQDREHDEQAVAALGELRLLDHKDTELVEAAVKAAGAGASAPAIEQAITRGSLEPEKVSALQMFRAAEPFERIHRAVRAAAEDRPELAAFLVGLGPVREYMPRADFATSVLQIGGFEVRQTSGFDTTDEAVKSFVASGCALALVCGTERSYAELGLHAVRLLRESHKDAIIILAGQPPDDLRSECERADAVFFIHMDSDVPATLAAIASRLGVTL